MALLLLVVLGFADAKTAYEQAVKSEKPDRVATALRKLAAEGLLSDDTREHRYARSACKKGLSHAAVSVRLAAAHGYAKMRMKGSSRDLKPYLKQAAAGKQPREFGVALAVAWGAIHDVGSHKVLLEIVESPSGKADQIVLAKACARAMKDFRAINRKKLPKLMDDFMQSFHQLYSKSHTKGAVDTPHARYWEAVEPEMVFAFWGLTGKRLTDYGECTEWWLRNRRSFGADRK